MPRKWLMSIGEKMSKGGKFKIKHRNYGTFYSIWNADYSQVPK
jgi:hypothetical protein